jgi:6,7-dimethyl-8-ribityllumazine synthase
MAGRAPRPRRPVPAPGRRAGARGRPRFAVVAARFNERITKRLLDGALAALAAAGAGADRVDVHWVPGSFELPQAAGHLARTGRYAAIVCVGCVIRGQTPHFDLVAGQAAAGIERVALDTGVPTAFGVVTALDEEQAWDRAGGAVGNRGQEAAEAALEMADWVRDLRRPAAGGRGGA